MRSYGLSRYTSYRKYRPASLHSRDRANIYKRLSSSTGSKSTVTPAAQYQYKSYSGSLNNAVSDVASSVSEMSRAMSWNDREKMYDAAKSFIDSYNELYTAAGGKRWNASVMTNTAKAYSATLERAGVTLEKDGTLSLDKESFMSADESAVSSAFGKRSAFTGAVITQAVNISRYAESESYTGYGSYLNNSISGYAGNSKNGILAGYLLNKWF